jgi:hypothetical protein
VIGIRRAHLLELRLEVRAKHARSRPPTKSVAEQPLKRPSNGNYTQTRPHKEPRQGERRIENRIIDEQEVYEIGIEAYTYLYSLVLMDATRRVSVNDEAGKVRGRGPMNAFTHVPIFPPLTSVMSYGQTSTLSTP